MEIQFQLNQNKTEEALFEVATAYCLTLCRYIRKNGGQ
jgi:hypothetical protein